MVLSRLVIRGSPLSSKSTGYVNGIHEVSGSIPLGSTTTSMRYGIWVAGTIAI